MQQGILSWKAVLRKRFIHVLLTRFNVKIAGGSSGDRDWLEHRFELFERFCFPSVCAQSCQNFQWLVFLSASLPADLRARIDGYARFKRFTPVYIPEYFTQDSVRRAVAPLTEGYDHLITSRLDNDDALATRFMEAVQSRFDHQTMEFINLPNGYIISNSGVYAWSHLCNSFISLVERTESFETVLCGPHDRLWRKAPVQQVEEFPGWLQAIHGRNLANYVRGVPIGSADWAPHFSIYPACLASGRDGFLDSHSQRIVKHPQ